MIRINFKEQIVKDEKGKEIISFEKAKALPTRSCYSVINPNHEKIGKIEKSRYNFGLVDLPKIDISINGDKITIRKDMQELKEIYEITGSGFSIIGDFTGPHFNISKNEKVIASVTIDKEETDNSYLVDIINKSNENHIICILFALSWII
nr:hypothetical protein [Clostridium paraputrificum]